MADGGPRPGWYDDPETAGMLRYWDGETWTLNRALAPIGPSPVAHFEDSRAGLALGFAIVGFFFAPLGIAGLVLGIVELRRISAGRVRPDQRGLAVAAVVLGGLLALMILAAIGLLIAFVLLAGDPGPVP